jgi:hypothetical protein
MELNDHSTSSSRALDVAALMADGSLAARLAGSVHRYLDISLRHLPAEEREALRDQERADDISFPRVLGEERAGWVVTVPPLDDDGDDRYDAHIARTLPHLHACLTAAREMECTLCSFDPVGPTFDGLLPTFPL